jgi:hypothetical protein
MKIQDQGCGESKSEKLKQLGITLIPNTVEDFHKMLEGFHKPKYWGVWEEWCFRESADQVRGYATEIEACEQLLIHLLETNKLTADDCNKRLNP